MQNKPSQHNHAMTLGFEQFFEEIYQTEFSDLYGRHDGRWDRGHHRW